MEDHFKKISCEKVSRHKGFRNPFVEENNQDHDMRVRSSYFGSPYLPLKTSKV